MKWFSCRSNKRSRRQPGRCILCHFPGSGWSRCTSPYRMDDQV